MLNRKNGIKQTKPWNQQFIGVFTGALGRVDRTALHRRERALKHLGFKELEQGIYIRPDNLAISFSLLTNYMLRVWSKLQNFDPVFDAQTKKIELWSTKTLNQNYQKYAQMIEQWLETANELDLYRNERIFITWSANNFTINE
jgi:phenylacetic acid degradation operon negative regulatory protein